MKIRELLFACLLAAIVTTGIQAEEAVDQFTIGVGLYREDYHEHLTLPFKSEERGNLPVVVFAYDHIKQSDLYYGFTGEYAWGNTTYDGSLMGPSGYAGPATSVSGNDFINLEARFGKHMQVTKPFGLTPFIGVGYHYWLRKGSDSVTDYDETYQWWYGTFGFRSNFTLNETWDIGFNAKLMKMFSQRMRVPAYDRTYNLGSKWQYELELPISYHIKSAMVDTIRLVPFARRLDIGESNHLSGFYEPSSRTCNNGLRIEFVTGF